MNSFSIREVHKILGSTIKFPFRKNRLTIISVGENKQNIDSSQVACVGNSTSV